MKKIWFILTFIIALISTLSFGMTTAYAEETQTERSEEVVLLEIKTAESDTFIESTGEKVSSIGEWIIAGVLGLLGTGVVSVGYKKHLKSLANDVKGGLNLIKENKDKSEEDINKIIKEASETLASLKTIKKEMRDEIKLVKHGISYIAGGTKELVANGTAESINNLMRNMEVKENASEKV